MITNKYILLTIDVEDWFQVENFKPWIPFSTWDQRELRVEKNVHQLLDLFDSIELKGERKMLGGWEVEKLGKGEKLRSQPNLSSLISSDQRSELNRDQPIQLNQPNINPQPTTQKKFEQNKHPQNPVNPVRKNKKKSKQHFLF